MKFFTRFLFVSMLLVSCLKHSSANSLYGGEIGWKYLGNDTFEIDVIVYWNCINAGNITTITPDIISDSCSNFYSISPGSYTSWTTEKVIVACNDTSCGATTTGFDKHTFKYKVYLGGSYASCCWYKISLTYSTRASNITTGYADQVFKLSAWLNRCYADNSPVFKNKPLTAKCAGQDLAYNPGVFDVDHDSLGYSFGTPSDMNSYSSPWAATYPFTCLGGNNSNPNANPPTGFNLDSVTGQYLFRPMQVQISVLKTVVKEYRKVNGVSQLIGVTARDCQAVIVQNCNNKLPLMSGPYNVNFCANSSNCYTINTTDADSTDSTTVYYMNTIPGASLTTSNGTVKHASGTICWTPSDSDAAGNPYYLNVLVRDNHCSVIGESSRAYSIVVTPEMKTARSIKSNSCGKYSVTVKCTDSFTGNLKIYKPYKLAAPAGNTILFTSNAISLTGNMKFDSTGTYIVKTEISRGGCIRSYMDTIIVDTPFYTMTKVNDLGLCKGQSYKLIAPSGIIYTLSPAYGLNKTSGDSILISTDSTIVYNVNAVNSFGCSDTSSFKVTVFPNKFMGLSSYRDSICEGSSTTVAISGITSFTWSPTYSSIKRMSNVLEVKADSDITFNIFGTNATGCIDTLQYRIIPISSNTINISPKYSKICLGSSVSLKTSGGNNYSWFPSPGLNNYYGANVIASPAVTTSYIVFGYSAQCLTSDTAIVEVVTTQVRNASQNTSICPGDSAILKVSGAVKCKWFPSSGLTSDSDTIVIARPLVSTVYTALAFDGICSTQVTVPVTILARPALTDNSISHSICKNNSLTLTVSGASSYKWFPSTGLNTDTGSTVIATPLSSTAYSVSGDNGLCKSTLIIPVTVTPPLQLTDSSSKHDICMNEAVSLKVSGAAKYKWHPSNGLSNDTGSIVIARPDTDIVYTVTGTSGNCEASINIPVRIHKPVVSISPQNIILKKNNSIMLIAKGASGYAWSPKTGLNKQSGDTVLASPAADIRYMVIGTDKFGCTAWDTVSITIDASGILTAGQTTPVLMPNPGNGKFRVKGINAAIELVIYNPEGKTVYGKQLFNEETFEPGLPAGVYLVIIKAGEQSFRTKLVITE
jgi:hypothetical protein